MHKDHLIGCAFGIAIAATVVVLTGGSSGSLGALAAVLLCPVAMAGAMWLLMRTNGTTHANEPSPPQSPPGPLVTEPVER